MQRPPFELVERFEEDGDERMDVPCRVLGRLDRLAVVGVREAHTDAGRFWGG